LREAPDALDALDVDAYDYYGIAYHALYGPLLRAGVGWLGGLLPGFLQLDQSALDDHSVREGLGGPNAGLALLQRVFEFEAILEDAVKELNLENGVENVPRYWKPSIRICETGHKYGGGGGHRPGGQVAYFKDVLPAIRSSLTRGRISHLGIFRVFDPYLPP